MLHVKVVIKDINGIILLFNVKNVKEDLGFFLSYFINLKAFFSNRCSYCNQNLTCISCKDGNVFL